MGWEEAMMRFRFALLYMISLAYSQTVRCGTQPGVGGWGGMRTWTATMMEVLARYVADASVDLQAGTAQTGGWKGRGSGLPDGCGSLLVAEVVSIMQAVDIGVVFA